MREQLIQYVNLLFAGAADCEEIRQEILQNTLDRFDDLVSQGKSPEAAYRLAISGIGDINEILGTVSQAPVSPPPVANQPVQPESEDDIKRKKTRAIAIALYILCALPLIVLGDIGFDNLGLCLTLALVAVATYLMIVTGKKDDEDEDEDDKQANEPKHQLKESIGKLIWILGLVAYFGISFVTGAWYITWLIFPIMACARGLSDAIIDLVEVTKNER